MAREAGLDLYSDGRPNTLDDPGRYFSKEVQLSVTLIKYL